MIKKIFISGNFLSGKQTILYLLDNRDCIIANFIHDQFIKSIIDLNNKIEKTIYKKKKIKFGRCRNIQL